MEKHINKKSDIDIYLQVTFLNLINGEMFFSS